MNKKTCPLLKSMICFVNQIWKLKVYFKLIAFEDLHSFLSCGGKIPSLHGWGLSVATAMRKKGKWPFGAVMGATANSNDRWIAYSAIINLRLFQAQIELLLSPGVHKCTQIHWERDFGVPILMIKVNTIKCVRQWARVIWKFNKNTKQLFGK